MKDTPRTDEVIAGDNGGTDFITALAKLSRNLERESDALRRELEGVAKLVCEFHGGLPDDDVEEGARRIIDQLAAAQKEIAALKRDKERLDWLEASKGHLVWTSGSSPHRPACGTRSADYQERDSVRQAIDSAIAQAKGEKA